MDNFKKVLLFSAVAIGISTSAYSMEGESENGCPKRGYTSYAISKILHPVTSFKEAACYLGQTSLARTGASYIASGLSATDHINEDMVKYISSTYVVQSFVPCFVKSVTGKLYGAYHHMLEYGANYFSALSKGYPCPFSPKIEDSPRNHDDQDHHHHHRLTYAEVVKIELKKYPAVKTSIRD